MESELEFESLNIHVVRKGTKQPVGLLESINADGAASVRWGVADGFTYRDHIPKDDIEVLRRTNKTKW